MAPAAGALRLGPESRPPAAHTSSWWTAKWTRLLPWALLALVLYDSALLRHGLSQPATTAEPAGAPVCANAGMGAGVQLLPALRPSARARTLVVYVFSGNDPESVKNLRFFLREAVQASCSRAPAVPAWGLWARWPALQAGPSCLSGAGAS